MGYDNWSDAVKELDCQLSDATPSQLRLAKHIGLQLDPTSPSLVAAAVLRVALCADLKLPGDGPTSDSQQALLADLPDDQRMLPSSLTEQQAGAWIQYLFLQTRRDALVNRELRRGDIVRTAGGSLREVSSIGSDGTIYFAGGMGMRAWPDTVRVVARAGANDPESQKAVATARNAASLMRPRTSWSLAKQADLEQFEVDLALSRSVVDRLRAVVDEASDEKPIQRFLSQHPAILARALLGATLCYCIPQKRLGGEYVPDFVIGDIDSLGVHWLLVELETPNSKLVTMTGELEKHAREGVKQVRDWRQWLTDNVAYARQPRAHGLGLYDISGHSPAVVIVGRREFSVEERQSSRLQLRDREQIAVHTYDWLIERAYSSLTYTGLPGLRSMAVDLGRDG